MSLIEIAIMAVGLAMDAFAVSVCKGLALEHVTWKNCVKAGIYFGGFQAAMPFIGHFLGMRFHACMAAIDYWIAFLLLVTIGMNMVKESFHAEEETDDCMDIRTMLILAVATSIDALAAGVSLACLQVKLVTAVLIIGIVTFLLSGMGIRIGNAAGSRLQEKAKLAGGVILIIIGIKILVFGAELV